MDLLHLVEELVRHAGHGDILREQVLAGDTAIAGGDGGVARGGGS